MNVNKVAKSSEEANVCLTLDKKRGGT